MVEIIVKNLKLLLKLLSLFFLLVSLVNCACGGGRNQTDSQWTRDMASQNSVKAQEGGIDGEILMRLPPEGTIARNHSYYPYPKDPLSAAKNLKNPLPFSLSAINEGKRHYETYCIYCHGSRGDGVEGASVAPVMSIPPPSLLTEQAKGYSDGRIYHIIHEGQGLMGAYRIQLNSTEQNAMSRYFDEAEAETKTGTGYRGSDRIWAIIHYIRSLQQKSDPSTN